MNLTFCKPELHRTLNQTKYYKFVAKHDGSRTSENETFLHSNMNQSECHDMLQKKINGLTEGKYKIVILQRGQSKFNR